MTADIISQRISKLSRSIEGLQAKYVSNPANAHEILSSALKSLQTSLEDLQIAEKVLKQQNEEYVKSVGESTDSLALVHELQVHQIELEMQNEELKRAKLETEGALAKCSDLYDFSPIGLFTLNTQGQTLEANLAGATLFGMERGSLMSKRFMHFVAPEDRPLFDDFCKLAFENPTKQTCELTLLRGKMPTVYARIEGIATENHLLNIKQIRIAIIDITDRKAAEEALMEAKDNLEIHVKERTEELEQANVRLQIEIAERKGAEEATKAEHQRLGAVLETLPAYVILLTPDYHVPFANRVFRERFGESRGRRCFEYLFGRNEPCEICETYTVLKTNEPHHWEWIGPDGCNYDIFDFPFTDSDGTFFIMEMGIDITERKNAEGALRAAWAYNRSLIEASLDPLVTIGPDGKITDVNAATESATGYRFEELVGTDFSDYFTDPESARAGYEKVFKEGYVRDYPLEIQHCDGHKTPVLYNASVYKNYMGQVVGVFAAARDMTERRRAEVELDKYRSHLEDLVIERTFKLEAANAQLQSEIAERKRMEEELRKSKDELEQKVNERTEDLFKANKKLQVEIAEHQKARKAAEAAAEAKAAFLANMSHELRTPLNAVIGFSSLLLDDNLTQTQKEYINSIRNGGQALLSIISDILELSKAEKEKISIECQPFSLKHCVGEAMDLVALQAEQKGLSMVFSISYGTPDTIISDHDRLRQILVNLLSNAVKFTDNGDISISVSSKVIEGNKRQITFAVKDAGIGMPQDKMERLFQPFTQLEYVISRKRDGAGLGLAICKKHVELLGGEIWAKSEEGIGSTFKFTIPAEIIPGKQLNLKEKNRAAAYESLSGQKPLSILVADDIPSNQKVLVEMLKGLGYRADAVADGIEVLQALQIRPYDLILMDIRMPQMDGLTATKEIRKLWPENGPKVVAITAFAMEGDKEKFLEAGMDGYIAKPVKVDDLVTLLCSINSS